jgi:NAD(P)-dependent dehydrogenase (short-subunit alcohol dehydrogenase family)
MPERAALITGGSSGIGLAIARMLGKDLGYALTVNGRRPDKLDEAVTALKDDGIELQAAPGNMADEEAIKQVVAQHRDAYGRMDVLINNAGIGVGSPIAEAATKGLDLQIGVNLRGVYLVLRESIPMLKEAGHEHGKALVVNMASIAGKYGQAWLSMYSATKHGVVGLSQSAHRELAEDGIQVTVLCPGFVDTAMADWTTGTVPREKMIQPRDIAESVRFLLSTSSTCIVPEIQFIRPGDTM